MNYQNPNKFTKQQNMPLLVMYLSISIIACCFLFSIKSTAGTKCQMLFKNEIANHKLKILYVDDEEMILEIATLFLEKAGFEVYTATNGADALMKFEDNLQHIDVIISDQNMPDISGDQLIELCKSRKTNIRTILVSGSLLDKQDIVMVDKIILKPIEWSPLIENLKQYLVAPL